MGHLRRTITESLTRAITSIRRASYVLLGSIDRTLIKSQSQIVVLSYHSVAHDTWKFSIDRSMLMKQISYLQKHYSILSLDSLNQFIKNKTTITKPSVVLTFDDGYKDILTMKDFFKKKNITPALFILANPKKPNLKELGTKRTFLSKREIISLHKAGWEIGCHSATHSNLAELSDKELYQEIVASKRSLEKDLGIKINYFAYPRGKYNAAVLEMVKKAKYKMAFTMDDGLITPGVAPLMLPRVGIDRTHTFAEFKTAFSPSVIRLRRTIKMTPIGRYL